MGTVRTCLEFDEENWASGGRCAATAAAAGSAFSGASARSRSTARAAPCSACSPGWESACQGRDLPETEQGCHQTTSTLRRRANLLNS